MGKMVLIKTDGTVEEYAVKKLEFDTVRKLIGCQWLERTKVRYENRIRDCWLDEEGLLRGRPTFNPHVRALAQDYWMKVGIPPDTIQQFVGHGVVWIP